MKNQSKLSKTGLIIPTAAEDSAINRGIGADPDAVELTSELATRLQPTRRLGRPPVEQPKVPVTMRVDADVLDALKATGSGWQTRVNQLLREAMQRGKLAA